MTTNRPTIIAHRGASAAHPENTVAAFAAAGPLGADAVELDVRRTSDGALVIHHDDALSDGRTIVGLTRAEVPPEIPDLAEALDACGDLVVNVEIKNSPPDADYDPTDAVTAGVLAELRRRATPERFLVSSFNPSTIARSRAELPDVPTAWLHLHDDVAGVIEQAVAADHAAVHPWFGWVTADAVALAHDRGLAVNVWTVDAPADIERMADLGVDGVVTNVPDVALEVLGGRAVR